MNVLVFSILVLFVLFFFIRFVIVLFSFRLLLKIKYVQTNPFLPKIFPSVSVVIAARNESENLKRNLPLVLTQNYRGKFEVIVVLDTCTDNSKAVIIDLKNRFKNLRYTEIFQEKKFDKYKKMAILLGVKAANFENLVFIDADCFPSSDKWLERISTKFVDNDLIIGYGGISKTKGILNILQRYDTLYNSILYFTAALMVKPYMAVGRNMAYKKDLFYKVGGFKNHFHLPSGNDDLFVRDVANFAKTEICIHPDSFVFTESAVSFKSFFYKKIRHISTSYYYKLKDKLFLFVDALSRFFYTPLLLFSLIFYSFNNIYFVKIILLLAVVKFLTELVIFLPIFKHFGENRLFWKIFWLEVIVPFIVGMGMIYERLKKNMKSKW